MIIWIDAQLSPSIASWITANSLCSALSIRDVGSRDATDHEIFMAARQTRAVVMTKDSDFTQLLDIYATPPQVIWLRCGNTSNANLKIILTATLQQALDLLANGEKLVEIRSP